MDYITILVLLATIQITLIIIWIKPFKKKVKEETPDISEKEYLAALIPRLPADPPRLHQYGTLVVRTERKKQKWHHEVWANDMSKKLIDGNSLTVDKRSYDELIKDVEHDIDEYLKDK